MFIPLLATLIMAGFVTTIGLVTEPAAEHFGVSISDIASQFSWLTAGVFVGGILAFFIFDRLPIKVVTIGSYLAAIVLIILLNRLKAYAFAYSLRSNRKLLCDSGLWRRNDHHAAMAGHSQMILVARMRCLMVEALHLLH